MAITTPSTGAAAYGSDTARTSRTDWSDPRHQILAGVVVALRPRYGGYIVTGWLAAIVLSLLTPSS